MDSDRKQTLHRIETFLKKNNIDRNSLNYRNLAALINHINYISTDLVSEMLEEVYDLNFIDHLERMKRYTARTQAFPVMGKSNEPASWHKLDLGIASESLGPNTHFANIESFSQTITHITDGKKMAYGGYGEPRPFYETKAYEIEGARGKEWRTVHMGIDIWAEAGTKIYAPYDGEVAICTYHSEQSDYGHLLIQKVQMDDGHFYILYGHLSAEIMSMYEVGDSISRGEFLAEIGTPSENGGWPAHLHLQVISHLLGKGDNFDGISVAQDWNIWEKLCPDPNIMLDLELPVETPKITINNNHFQRVVNEDSEHIELLARAYQQFLYSINGRRYLNFGFNAHYVERTQSSIMQDAYKFYSFRQIHSSSTDYIVLIDEIHDTLNELDGVSVEKTTDSFILAFKRVANLKDFYYHLQVKTIIVNNENQHKKELKISFHKDLTIENLNHLKHSVKTFIQDIK